VPDGPHFAVIAANADGCPQSSVIFVKRTESDRPEGHGMCGYHAGDRAPERRRPSGVHVSDRGGLIHLMKSTVRYQGR